MTSKGPTPEYVKDLKSVIAWNVRAYARVFYKHSYADTKLAQVLGTDSKVGKNTILRVLNLAADDDDRGARIDTLAKIANVFGVTVADLCTDHGIKKGHGKTARIATNGEPGTKAGTPSAEVSAARRLQRTGSGRATK